MANYLPLIKKYIFSENMFVGFMDSIAHFFYAPKTEAPALNFDQDASRHAPSAHEIIMDQVKERSGSSNLSSQKSSAIVTKSEISKKGIDIILTREKERIFCGDLIWAKQSGYDPLQSIKNGEKIIIWAYRDIPNKRGFYEKADCITLLCEQNLLNEKAGPVAILTEQRNILESLDVFDKFFRIYGTPVIEKPAQPAL
jgi:hypothetical protein